MATRIRRAVVAVALALLMATALAGVAWAANIRCPNVPGEPHGCVDTAANDTMYGTPGKDDIATASGDDTVHAYKGDDFIEGDKGNDTYYGALATTTWLRTAMWTTIAARTRTTAARERITSSATCDPRSTSGDEATT